LSKAISFAIFFQKQLLFAVLQIVKNKKSNNKLSIVFDGNKKRDYTFEQGQHRETFCQLMQHIRNKHSEANEPDCVSIFCGSWNMGKREREGNSQL